MIPAELGPPALEALAELFEQRAPAGPVRAQDLRRCVARDEAGAAAAALNRLAGAGFTSQHMALFLRQVAVERRALQQVRDQVELVWSGPEGAASSSRDTGAVVRGLFQRATRSVLLANYAFDRPRTEKTRHRARDLFQGLADRMAEIPGLQVRFVVNIARPDPKKPGAEAASELLVERFVERFFADLWPGARRPELYYDPRALEPWAENQPRASMHAKCLVVDEAQVLLTSANFTEAAQERNIEAGVLVQSAFLAQSLTQQFDTLCRSGALRRVPEPR